MKKVILNGEKRVVRKIFWHFFHTIFFIFMSNLELICACEFIKKLKFHLPKRLVQKLTRANILQIELETVWIPIQIALHSVLLPLLIAWSFIQLPIFSYDWEKYKCWSPSWTLTINRLALSHSQWTSFLSHVINYVTIYNNLIILSFQSLSSGHDFVNTLFPQIMFTLGNVGQH